MNKFTTLATLFVSALLTYSGESYITNLIVTAKEVDTRSIRLTATNSPYPNLTFVYTSKTSQDIEAILKSQPAISVAKDGVVIARASACAGFIAAGKTNKPLNFIGLVIIFDNLREAKLAEQALRDNSK